VLERELAMTLRTLDCPVMPEILKEAYTLLRPWSDAFQVQVTIEPEDATL
jgi:hypothetical protein